MSPSIQQRASSLMVILRELDSGLMNNTTWLKVLHRAMISGSAPNGADLLPDAHKRCHFGQWYYAQVNTELQDDQHFRHIGVLHEQMHELARALLEKKCNGQSVTADEYDGFMDQAIRFKLAVRGMQTDIINKVCEVDHLTGARNRNSMNYKLLEEHDRMLRNSHPVCVCMMDIDYFKQVNDEHGHIAGDSVLHAVVDFFGKKLRKYDSIFRYGGEEFLFCLPNTVAQEVVVIMDRLRLELSELPIKINSHGEVRITDSFGVAIMDRDEPVTDTVEKADHALLCAKAGGRNRVCLWNM